MTIKLGSKVRDKITTLEGIAVARTEWLNGCARVLIQPQMVKDGKPVDNFYVDEPQLEIIDDEHPATRDRKTDTGGPHDDAPPSRH